MLKIKYFNGQLSQGFVALFSGRMIQFASMGLIGLFLPIFLFLKFDFNVIYVYLFYLVGHLVYALVLPYGARFLNRIGIKKSLQISVVFDSAFYVFVYFIDRNPVLFITLSLVSIVLARLFFWIPYQTEFAKFTNRGERGKEYSLMEATKAFLDVLMPVASGLLIVFFGFKSVFLISIILLLSSSIPFLTLVNTDEKFSWGYLETFKNFFSKANRNIVLANLANGAENVVGVIIWPIFIWEILKGNYFAVGSLSSLIVLVTIILQLSVGKYTDLLDKRRMIRFGSFLYAAGWLLKMFVLTAFQIFLAGTYHSLVQVFKNTPFDVLNYQLMADHGHYVDEYTVIKELAIQFGKVLMLVFAIIITLLFGMSWTFALAALASLFINLL